MNTRARVLATATLLVYLSAGCKSRPMITPQPNSPTPTLQPTITVTPSPSPTATATINLKSTESLPDQVVRFNTDLIEITENGNIIMGIIALQILSEPPSLPSTESIYDIQRNQKGYLGQWVKITGDITQVSKADNTSGYPDLAAAKGYEISAQTEIGAMIVLFTGSMPPTVGNRVNFQGFFVGSTKIGDGYLYYLVSDQYE